jgi:hypothetical protein
VISWRDAPGEHPLALVLCELLVVVIWNLNPVPRGEQVQVKRVLPGGLIVEMVEDCLVISLVVERGEFGSIQKTAAPDTVDCQEVAELRGAPPQTKTGAGRAETTGACVVSRMSSLDAICPNLRRND